MEIFIEMLRLLLIVTKCISVTSLVVLSLELFMAPGLATQPQKRSHQSSLVTTLIALDTTNPGEHDTLPNSTDHTTISGQIDQTLSPAWTLSQTFKPPDRGAPPRTEDSGTRSGPSAASSQRPLRLLLPNVRPTPTRFGFTVSNYPTFFAYIPQSRARTGGFILLDDRNQLVYWTSFPMPKEASIVSISLPPTASPPLEVGKWYKWYLIVLGNPDRWGNGGISDFGWIQAIEPSETLANQLQNATPRDRPALYAEAGIWHDALASLVDLRRSQPNDATLAADWEELFNSAGLADFSQGAVVECCQVQN